MKIYFRSRSGVAACGRVAQRYGTQKMTGFETEFKDAFERGHACGTYLLGEYDREEMQNSFIRDRQPLPDFLKDHDCKVDVRGFTGTRYQGFHTGLKSALYGEAVER